MPYALIDYIRKLQPKYCIHFEPCYEYHDSNTIYGLLCKKYIEVNDYNRNLIVILRQAQKDGKIKILEQQKNVLGSNPLFPFSVIVWEFL